jgi:hypothetical protein
MSCPVPPELDSSTLLRVIPVGQHRQVEDVAITVYSLELYRNGFVAVLRVDWAGPSAGCFPGPRFSAIDDLGTQYGSYGGGGSGGGIFPDNPSWRTWQIFTPGLAAGATHLTLVVDEFRLTSFAPHPDRPGEHTRSVERVVSGPWRFEVGLS